MSNPAHYLVIRNTATGATLATIRPPKPFATFSEVTMAADDQTFVLAAAAKPTAFGWTSDPDPVKFFEGRYSQGQHSVALHSLPIPPVTGSGVVAGVALSPDASRLAIAINNGPHATSSQLKVYTLASGAVRDWRSPGAIGLQQFDPDAMSWANDGTLGVNWSDYGRANLGLLPRYLAGMYLLDTATQGGSLLKSSRFALSTGQGTGITNATLTPDGTKIIATQAQLPGKRQGLVVYSARTRKELAVLGSRPAVIGGWVYAAAIWSNPQGSVFIARALTLDRSNAPGYRIISSSTRKIIPVPGGPTAREPNYYLAF